jgi:hypothetical protein
MTRFTLLRLTVSLCVIAMLSACSGTKILQQWQTDAGPVSPAKKIAVIAMAPEEGMRLVVEGVIADQINSAGGSAVVSSKIRGMGGKLSREKAEAALKETDVDAVVVIFITGAQKGAKLERADYFLQYKGSYASNSWMSPQFVSVYSIQEGSGYYEQERSLILESTYYEYPAAKARWIMVTESSALEYRNTVKALTTKIIGQMKRDGAM